MNILKRAVKTIDSISEFSGAIGKWFALLLVLAGTYETVARHFFNSPTIWAYDTLCMSGGALYLLGASYDYLHDAHTRVDLFFNMLSPRKQALMNVAGSILFFFPLMVIMFKMAFEWAVRAWRINEVFFNSFWYPPAGPYRTIFAIGLFLLILQGVANFIRDLFFLIRGENLD